MAAWLYVASHVAPGRKRSKRVSIPADWRPVVLIIGLVLLPIPIIVAPIPEDPSCHNTLRGERSSASPAAMLHVQIGESKSRELAEIYDQFEDDYSLSVRKHNSTSRSICNEDVTIKVGGTPNERYIVIFYEHTDGAGWEPMANELICRLEAKWGDTMVFTGGGGEEVPKPAIFPKECGSFDVGGDSNQDRISKEIQ
jgi:hypothetical protein